MRTISRILQAAGDRLGRRATSQAAEPGRLAFASVSTDQSLLGRLPRDQARRLAALAETFAASLLKDAARGEADARHSAGQVMRTARQFIARDALLGASVDDMIVSALTRAPDGLGGLIAVLERETRRPGDASLILSIDAVIALGHTGLQRLDSTSAEVLMLAASRHAASRLREAAGALQADMAQALDIVETVCAGWRALPLATSLAGMRREQAEELVDLWRDGRTCAERLDAGPAKRLWEDARDACAFGAVRMMPGVLSSLVRPEADALARDARAACMFVLRCRSLRPGVHAAMEAARTVLVSCEGWSAEAGLLVVEPRRAIGVRPEAPPARAAHA